MNFITMEIDVNSPIESVQIGTDLEFYGTYVNGFQWGTSKVVRIYKEIQPIPPHVYFAKLENNKLIILGFEIDNVFEPSKRFASHD